jgi:hypothetical protein
VAVTVALVALAGTVSVAGSATIALLLDRLTLSPPLGAAALKVTVQESVPGPVMDALLQESAVGVMDGGVPPEGVRKATNCIILGPDEPRGAVVL